MAISGYGVTNLKIVQRTGLSPGGAVTQTITVTYNVGSDGPFIDSYPAAGFTDAEAQAGIQKRIQQLTNIRNGVGAQPAQ